MAAIAIAGEEGAVLSAQQQASKLLNFALPTKGIQGIAINADSTRISVVTGSPPAAIIVSMASNKFEHLYTIRSIGREFITCAIFLRNRPDILVGCHFGKVKRYKLGSVDAVQCMNGPQSSICDLFQSSNGLHVASRAANDGSCVVWNAITGAVVSLLGSKHAPALTCGAFVGEYWVLLASARADIQLWDFVTSHCLHTFHGHRDAVRSLCVLSSEVFASAAQKSIRFWNLSKFTEIRESVQSKPVSALQVLQGRLVVGLSDGSRDYEASVIAFDFRANQSITICKSIHGAVLLCSSDHNEIDAIESLSSLKSLNLNSNQPLLKTVYKSSEPDAPTLPDADAPATTVNSAIPKRPWASRIFSGRQQFNLEDGSQLDVSFERGRQYGAGSCIMPDGTRIEGLFHDGQLTGVCRAQLATGGLYEGQLCAGKPHGLGTCTYNDGSAYSGSWLMGLRDGFGVLTGSNGEVYEGLFKQGEQHGHGVATDPDHQHAWEGLWRSGRRHGRFIKLSAEATTSAACEFDDDVLVTDVNDPNEIVKLERKMAKERSDTRERFAPREVLASVEALGHGAVVTVAAAGRTAAPFKLKSRKIAQMVVIDADLVVLSAEPSGFFTVSNEGVASELLAFNMAETATCLAALQARSLLAVGTLEGLLLLLDHTPALTPYARVVVSPDKPVDCIAVTADASLVACGSNDGHVTLVDAQRLAVLCQFKHKSDASHVQCVCFVGAAVLAVGYGSGRISLVRTSDGTSLHEHAKHKGAVNTMAISADASLLASASSDRSAKLFDAASLEPLYSFSFDNIASGLVFVRNHLCIGVRGSHVREYDVKTFQELPRLTKHDGAVVALASLPHSSPHVHFEQRERILQSAALKLRQQQATTATAPAATPTVVEVKKTKKQAKKERIDAARALDRATVSAPLPSNATPTATPTTKTTDLDTGAPLRTWTPEHVGAWVRRIGLGVHAAAFAEASIDGIWLEHGLTDEDMQELGVVSVLDRKRLRLRLAQMTGLRIVPAGNFTGNP